MSMIVNRRDVDFYLDEMFDLGSLLASDRYSEHDRESITAVLDLCQNMAEEEFLPLAAEHDENEPVFKDGQAITPDSLKSCLKTFVEAGLPTATFDHDLGGMQLPVMVANFMHGLFQAANAPATARLRSRNCSRAQSLRTASQPPRGSPQSGPYGCRTSAARSR